jgi:hypothetical protein
MNTLMQTLRFNIHRRLMRNVTLLAFVVLAAGTAVGDLSPEGRRARGRQGFELFASPTLILQGNQFQCGINNIGDVCTAVDISGPSGGVWPLGTSNGYVFNTGMQVAGILSDEAGPWAGDTIGVYMFDASWGNRHGTKLTSIYDSLNPDDLEAWPAEAYVGDPEIFASILLGRKTASQQDSWVQYWEGDPLRNVNRKHPLGVKFTQRSMSWNYPSGNESVIYFIFEIENVTADPEFQRLNEQFFFGGDPALPDGGWAIEDMYASFGTDMDVGDATLNFSTAILPFDAGISYVGTFHDQFFRYPPAVFYPPFFTATPGLVGIKYLKSPTDPATGEEVGLTLFSITQNPGSPPIDFPDPSGDTQLWRYLSGQLDAGKGDGSCNVQAEIATANPVTTKRSVCYVSQRRADTRFYQASGPFDLDAGQSGEIVVAYIAAPTVETMPDGTGSGIVPDPANANRNPPGFPSFHPGFTSHRGCDVNGTNCSVTLSTTENAVLPIEKGAGWVQYEGAPPSGSVYPSAVEHPSNKIEQYDVSVVPGSFLARALVAQSVFDNKFLLGFPPEPPVFYLIPGDDQVTVIWEPSSTETSGDPFYEIAGDSESALYNPNYRRLDVEGYRVWRSTTVGGAELIAQFDHADTQFLDHTCETVHPEEDVGVLMPRPDVGDSVPVVGYAAGEICPFDEDNPITRPIDGRLVFNNGGAGGPPGGGVARNPAAAVVDTAVLADRVTGPVEPLRDTGVPFVYVDTDVYDNFTYFYSVTAFDLNSMASGPHTLRSVQVSQSVTPRADAPNLVTPDLQMFVAGDDGEPLDTEGFLPVIDAESGTFASPFPPTDATAASVDPLIASLLPQYHLTGRIDSVVPVFSLGSSFGTPTEDCSRGGDPFHTCLKLYLTVDGGEEPSNEVVDVYNPWWGAFGEQPLPQEAQLLDAEVVFDPDALDAFGFPPTLSGEARLTAEFNEAINNSAAAGAQNRRFGVIHGGSRWFDGADENTSDPARYIRVGHLSGVDTVWAPIAYAPVDAGAPVSCGGGFGCSHFEKQCFERALAKLGRAADVSFAWNGGTFGEVLDITHGVEVPFAPKVRASWGFLTTDANSNGFIDWNDFNYLDPALEIIRDGVGGGECGGADAGGFVPVGPSVDLVDAPSIVPTSTDGIADGQNFYDGLSQTGQGFGLYVNGERYIFELASLPADGTVWTLRTYSGYVNSDEASFDTADPRGYVYDDNATGNGTGSRPALVPGLTFHWMVEESTTLAEAQLSEVHTVPDPYLASSRYDRAPTTKKLMFVNLPPRATIRIYTVSGILVDILNHEDPTDGGRAEWDMRNRNNQFVASAVYFFHVVTPDGDEHVGKFTIINAVQ